MRLHTGNQDHTTYGNAAAVLLQILNELQNKEIILVGPTNQLSDYLIGTAILLIFLISDWMLSKQRWYGCILGTLLGAYYLICGVITYKRQKSIS